MDPLALAWKLHWYRQSELDGALLLGKVIRAAPDGYLLAQLTQHAAEEAEHARLWCEVIRELALPYIRIHRSYQSLYLEFISLPTSLTEVLAFTQIFERRVHRTFFLERDRPGISAAERVAYERMLEDEKGHLSWVADYLADRPDAARLLERYRLADEQLFEKLSPLQDRLWEVPGIGERV
jgi:hypothetical protein